MARAILIGQELNRQQGEHLKKQGFEVHRLLFTPGRMGRRQLRVEIQNFFVNLPGNPDGMLNETDVIALGWTHQRLWMSICEWAEEQLAFIPGQLIVERNGSFNIKPARKI